MKMSLLLFALVSGLSAAAHADYFKCELTQMSTVLASSEAEYRVLETSTSAEGFICEGRIDANGNTRVKLTDTSDNRISEISEKGSSASTYLSTLPRHNEYDVVCTCGMN